MQIDRVYRCTSGAQIILLYFDDLLCRGIGMIHGRIVVKDIEPKDFFKKWAPSDTSAFELATYLINNNYDERRAYDLILKDIISRSATIEPC